MAVNPKKEIKRNQGNPTKIKAKTKSLAGNKREAKGIAAGTTLTYRCKRKSMILRKSKRFVLAAVFLWFPFREPKIRN